MNIAIVGTRGIPARYGGFETLAEQLSARLAARGHEVTVYCRRPFTRADDVIAPGVRRVILPTISRKHFDTAFHTFLSLIHVSFTPADVVFICNVANGPIAWIPRLFGKPTVLNVDGFDRKRKKWNLLGQSALYICELFSAFTPTRIVTDSRIMHDYYWRHYRRRSAMITYGAEEPANGSSVDGAIPKLPDLPVNRFILYVSRLEPENNPELLVKAYSKVQTDWPLVIVGGNSYKPAYVERLKALADRRVLFLGPVYGTSYWELLRNAGLYVFGCEVGGVHPALIEAMAAEKPLLYLDTPENRETAGEGGVPFRAEAAHLSGEISRLLNEPAVRRELGRKARERAARLFAWDDTAQKYESLFFEVVR
ncbi:MAG TPA: glycosyltransferase [Terriglobales bacterium]|nr:glycosyltransferase [Terriglobales bacterium]